MSSGAGLPDQRMKGHGNQVANGPKDSVREHENFDNWRGQQQQQQHQGYTNPMATALASDPYMPSYYGASYPYQTFGVSDGTWSNGADPMTFLGGYGAQMGHDSYNIDGMFGAGSFSGFGQPSFNYGFHGNNDYSTWGGASGVARKPHYGDYYQDGASVVPYRTDDRGMKMVEQGMQGLGISDGKQNHDGKDMKHDGMMMKGGMDGMGMPPPMQKKMTWANIASQPAKLQPQLKKKSGGAIPPPPMMSSSNKNMDIGTWEAKNGSVMKPNVPPPAPRPSWGGQRGRGSGGPPAYVAMPQHPPAAVATLPPPAVSNQPQNSPNHPFLSDLQVRNKYNPVEFDMNPACARFFVIKSYTEDDIHRSIKYEIWCSTEHGNKRLDTAFRERETKGTVYLFFSVNGSGHFCGMAEMVSPVDHSAQSSVWSQDKWKGQFKVKWIYVKDVPNTQLRHIRLENNDNKPVTNSRDTQEIPVEKGKQVLRILHSFHHASSIFDDFIHYEKRQEEDDQRKSTCPVLPPGATECSPTGSGGSGGNKDRDRDGVNSRDRDNGGSVERGGHSERGGGSGRGGRGGSNGRGGGGRN